MKIGIIGGGVGGKICASLLNELKCINSVVVFEASTNNYNQISHNYTGIWTPVMEVFNNLCLSKALLNQFKSVGLSSYK
jgi:2-polyprenyl-6-methoxyphenol hydroxylase-like FAD-dependent oxidoreductase